MSTKNRSVVFESRRIVDITLRVMKRPSSTTVPAFFQGAVDAKDLKPREIYASGGVTRSSCGA